MFVRNDSRSTGVVVALMRGLVVTTVLGAVLHTYSQAQCNPIQIAKVGPSDGVSDDYFGSATAVSGNTCVVGAYEMDGGAVRSGAAYVYRDDGRGNWLQIAKLISTDGATGDRFGSSVAIDGNLIVVGAYEHNLSHPYSGAVYLFREDGSGNWNQVAELGASNGASISFFGASVAVQDDDLVVGAPDAGVPVSYCGAAYVFHNNGADTWVQSEILTSENPSTFGYFGCDVAIWGDTILVGEDGSGYYYQGKAYFFTRQSDGFWKHTFAVQSKHQREYGAFGASVSLSGDTAVIGAPYTEDQQHPPGVAYIFRRNTHGHWFQISALTGSDSRPHDGFGGSVAIDGDTVIVGARYDADLGTNTGSAYLFRDMGMNQWAQTNKILASDAQEGTLFGYSVGISSNTAVVGACGVTPFVGSAYVFDVNCGPTLDAAGSCPGPVTFDVNRATPGGSVAFVYAKSRGVVQIPPGNPCAGTTLGLNGAATLLQILNADSTGQAEITVDVPAQGCNRAEMQAVDLSTCTTSNVILFP